MSQRLAVVLLTVVLFIIGAALGTPGQYPLVNGSYLTPDLLMSVIVPIVAGIATLVGFFAALQAKVTAQAINPNDLGALLFSKEFVVYFVALLAGLSELFNIRIFDNNTQAMLVDAIMIVAALLLRDYAVRPGGSVLTTEALNAQHYQDCLPRI